jgi:hypothetical protein
MTVPPKKYRVPAGGERNFAALSMAFLASREFSFFATTHAVRAKFWSCATAFVLALLRLTMAAEVKIERVDAARFVGSAGCKSSSCHGGAGEKRSQYQTWSQRDFHPRAYAVLTNARSARIAETLGISPAQTISRCTVCHSPFQSVAPVRLGPDAHPDEGVSCEGCHGAAEPWLRGHTRKDWAYATRVSTGMRDLRSFYVRANTCVACHQNIEADILKAGHPELTFELDGQSVAEPKHWRDDDPLSGLRAWLVGQAVALREISWNLAKTNTPSPDRIAPWKGLAWLLGKVAVSQNLPVIAPSSQTESNVAEVQQAADALARRASDAPLSDDTPRVLLQVLAETDLDFSASPAAAPEEMFRRAQRLVLALDRLSDAVAHEATREVKNPKLVQLFEDVRSIGDFQSPRFAEHLKNFRATIAQAPH